MNFSPRAGLPGVQKHAKGAWKQMKTGEKRLIPWMICVLTALFIWSGLYRGGQFIPVRGTELPGRAVDILAERVENGQACTAIHDLRFREVYTAWEGRFCFVNGYFDAEGTAYRYAVALYQTPFDGWYLYDTTRETVFDDVPPEKVYETWVDFLLFRYNVQVFYDEMRVTRGPSPDGGKTIIWVLLLAAVVTTDRFFRKKGDKDMQQLAMAVVWVLYLLASFIWIAASEPAVRWIAGFK